MKFSCQFTHSPTTVRLPPGQRLIASITLTLKRQLSAGFVHIVFPKQPTGTFNSNTFTKISSFTLRLI